MNRLNRTLQVIYNGVLTDMSPADIFDVQTYQKLYAVTYSVDESFLNQYLTGFQTVDLVVGIRDAVVQSRAVRGFTTYVRNLVDINRDIIQNRAVDFFEALDGEVQNRCVRKQIRIRKPLDVTVHSKFYLMESSDSVRYVIGSANLSAQAFSSGTAQYETILVCDDDVSVYRILKSQFDEIVGHTVDFLADALMHYYEQKKEALSKLEKDTVMDDTDEDVSAGAKNVLSVHFTTSEKADIQVGILKHLHDVVKFGVNDGIVDETVLEDIRQVQELELQSDKLFNEDVDNLKRACQVVRKFVPNTSVKPKLQTWAMIKKQVPQILVRQSVSKKLDVTERPEQLYSNPGKRHLNYTGLYQISDKTTMVEQPFGQPASIEQIKEGILSICNWIGLYQKYVENVSDVYCSRIMESILYAFTSPFLHEIQMRLMNGKEDVPLFLIIGGAGGSGKSQHLRFIKRLLGFHENLMLYNNIVPPGTRNQKSLIKQTLQGWLIENNVAPICVDEVSEDFFSVPQYGEELIVNTVNATIDSFSASPVCILTTNSSNYLLRYRARRRSYYLKQDKIFNVEDKKEELPALAAGKSLANDILFQDFCLRFSNLLLDETVDWDTYHGSGLMDFLYHTRGIFREYFKIAGLDVPSWFPNDRFNDAEIEGQNRWRNYYLYHKDAFSYQADTDTYAFEVGILDKQSSRYGSVSESKRYLSSLGPGIRDEDKSSQDIVILYAHKFHEWLDVPFPEELQSVSVANKGEKKGFLHRLQEKWKQKG